MPGPADLPRHVWFQDTWSGVTARQPQLGLLVEWQRRDDGWWGLVLHVHAGGLKFGWVRGAELRPYEADGCRSPE